MLRGGSANTTTMARKTGSTLSGKLGDKIHYTWHGRPCERSMPQHVHNPRTEAQQAHRLAFATVSRLSSCMKEAHLIGLHALAVREKNSTYALFKHLNKDCVLADGQVDYASLVVSHGPVPPVDLVSAHIEGGTLAVAFDSRATRGRAADEFHLFVLCPAAGAGQLAPPVPRGAGALTLSLPEGWASCTLHLYAFLRSSQGRTSDTLYRPLDPHC